MNTNLQCHHGLLAALTFALVAAMTLGCGALRATLGADGNGLAHNASSAQPNTPRNGAAPNAQSPTGTAAPGAQGNVAAANGAAANGAVVNGTAPNANSHLARPELTAADRARIEARLTEADLPLAELYALNVSLALGRSYRPDELSSGAPVALLAALESIYGPTSTAIATVREESARFETAWRAYQARRAEVADAMQRAQGLRERGQVEQAITVLQGAITEVTLEHRGMHLPMDAEVPLLLMLGELATAASQHALLFEAARHLSARRRVGAVDDERHLWLVNNQGRLMGRYFRARHPSIQAAGQHVLAAYEQQLEAPHRLARGYLASIQQQLVTRVTLGDQDVSPGTWVMLEVPRGRQVSGNTLTYDRTSSWRQPYGCRTTDRITGIDPTTGRFTFAQRCNYRDFSERIRIRAALAAPPPSWVESSRALSLVAEVVRPGKNWRLEQAFVPDLRWLTRRSPLGAGCRDVPRGWTQGCRL